MNFICEKLLNYCITNSSRESEILRELNRLYLDNDYIFQSEYREAFKNSNLIADFSINRKENTNTHFFSELEGVIDDTTNYKIQIQNVTNDNYLKIHDIKEYTSLVDSDSTLTSFINLERNIDQDKF